MTLRIEMPFSGACRIGSAQTSPVKFVEGMWMESLPGARESWMIVIGMVMVFVLREDFGVD
jgi:hypothetical protein